MAIVHGEPAAAPTGLGRGGTSALAQTLAAYRPTDTSVVDFPSPLDPMGTPGVDACAGSGKKLVGTIHFNMKRAIGDSTLTASNGSLINPATLVSNRAVAKNAELELLIGDFVWQPAGNRPKPPVKAVRISFKINGHDVPGGVESTPTPEPGQIHKLKFPVEFLRFPVRAPLSQQPVERPNTIEVYWNPSDFISPLGWKICGIEQREIILNPRRVRFDAMAPIILIHGNNECAGFFKTTGAAANCVAGKDKQRFNFESALKEARVPYDLSINMATDTVNKHAEDLGRWSNPQSIHQIARSFGAKRCHIIAHSKGGLDSRQFLAWLPKEDPASAPLSLITLTTPHKGSPGGDYLAMVRLGVKLGMDSQTQLRLAGSWAGWLTDIYSPAQWSANADLTTQKGGAFHTTNAPQLPRSLTVEGAKHKVTYYAIVSDANANNSFALLPPGPSIDPPEEQGLDVHWRVATFVYQMMGETRSVKVTIRANMIPPGIYLVAVAEPTSGFQMNDVAVPLWSQSPGTPFVQSSTLFRRNHASIAFPDAAEHCLWFIRYTAQPLDPGLKGLQ